jgi:DNA-binding NtrC family response regulator
MTTGPGYLEIHPLWSSLGLLTRTPELIDTLHLAETYAPEDIPILILGETGTGKDLVAQGIHQLSQRKGGYVPVNCAAAQRDLFAAELFGARKGAYTGAIEHREGLVRAAEGGTLFFDEIADLNREAQGYLLRFLDSGEIRPLGDSKSIRVETRIVAATCRDLSALATQNQFRHDLHARLAAVVLTIPPLRKRAQDLESLIDMLWQRRGGRARDRQAVFTPEVMADLSTRPWPGNVRELAHLVARILPLARGAATVSDTAIADLLRAAGRGWAATPDDGGTTAEADALAHSPHRFLRRNTSVRWPRAKLIQALDDARGHVPTAARILGLSRSQAYRLYRALKDQD